MLGPRFRYADDRFGSGAALLELRLRPEADLRSAREKPI